MSEKSDEEFEKTFPALDAARKYFEEGGTQLFVTNSNYVPKTTKITCILESEDRMKVVINSEEHEEVKFFRKAKPSRKELRRLCSESAAGQIEQNSDGTVWMPENE